MTQPTMLRNAVLFALAFDATDAEIDTAIDSINRFFERTGISPTQIANGAQSGPSVIAGPGSTPLLPSAAAPAADGQVVKDSAGLPWDERIHSSTKGFNTDGTWRARRNVDKGTVAKVTAELLAVVNAGGAVPTPPAAPAAPLLPPAPPAAPLLPPAPAAVNTAFTDFVQFITANTRSDSNPAGRLTAEYVRATLQFLGVPNGDMQNLAHNAELCKSAHDYIVAALAA